MDSNIALKVENVTKVYKLYDKPVDRLKEALFSFKKKRHNDFYALKDISFEVKKGETIGIIGKNGSGKSTLLKMITGVLTPSLGKIEVNGRISALLELGAGFNPEYTGIENIYLNGTIMGFSKEEMEGKLNNIIEFADIGEFIYQPVKMYSSGMFVRLAFAVAINVEPEIFIVDEALSVGDIRFQKKCLEKIDDIKRSGKTILFCSHDMHAVSELCDRVVWVKDSEIAEYGDSRKVISSYISYMSESQSIKEKLNVEISNPYYTKKHTDEVEILSVNILDRNGEYKTVFYTGDDLIFDICIDVKEGINEPNYSVLILNNKGESVALSKSSYLKEGFNQGKVQGKKQIVFTLKNIAFNSGKYLFGISVWDKASKIIFAVDRTTEFEIKSLNIVYGPMEEKAVFFPAVEWTINDKTRGN